MEKVPKKSCCCCSDMPKNKKNDFEVKDLSLASQGRMNIEWAETQMGALLKVRERFAKEKPLKGIRVGMALHVTKETAVLVETLMAGGAQVSITGCNPLSTQDDVAAALAEAGVNVWAYKGESSEDYYRYIRNVIETKPQITIDDGCDLVSEIHTNYPELIDSIIGGAEETTTGIIRLRAMEKDNALKYPIIGVNESETKHLMDNIKGTGQSTLDGILRATNILLAGKTLVIAGYGNCGKGVAKRAQGMDANIVVTEVNPFRALQASMDGFRVMPMAQACKIGEIFVTITGVKHVIRPEHIEQMKNGAILANSGHFDNEIDVEGLKLLSKKTRRIRPSMDEYSVGEKKVYLLGEGRLVNLACAEGHPSAIMAMSFINQSFACEQLVKNKGKLESSVYILPTENGGKLEKMVMGSLDIPNDQVARLQIETMGIEIDELTEEQKEYLTSWQEGT
jgi:adenosylhomocysteinase